MNDHCIGCETFVKYKVNDPVEGRACYIDGLGQLCDNCYNLLMEYTHEYE